jgi:hypothetical protein
MAARGTMLGAVAAALMASGLVTWNTRTSIAAQTPGPAMTTSATSPVLVELFTSEGCSSCPPADRLLTRFIKETPINGTDVIALGYHVDYWDRLGWKDRFSSAAFTERQNRYAQAWKSDQIFTPQTVVDGRAQFVGTDARKIVQAIEEARTRPRAQVALRLTDGATPRLGLTITPPSGTSMSGEIWLAIAEDGLVSDVKAGENANQHLEHAGVVRRLDRIGKLPSGLAFSLDDYGPKLDPSWTRGSLRAVVIVQDEKTRAILGAGQIKL